MNNLIIAPSILSADFSRLGEQIRLIDEGGAEFIHIDVMDGKFVPSISFGMPVMKSIRGCTDKVFDVHLMIEEPQRYINDFKEAGADLISVHAEACTHLNRTVNAIKEAGMKACVAINPATDINCLKYIIEDLDMVLIMSVNPGFGGQKYIKSITRKIRDTRQFIDEYNPDIRLQVDGGVNIDNIKEIVEAGADTIVAGTAVFSGDIKQNIQRLKLLELKGEHFLKHE